MALALSSSSSSSSNPSSLGAGAEGGCGGGERMGLLAAADFRWRSMAASGSSRALEAGTSPCAADNNQEHGGGGGGGGVESPTSEQSKSRTVSVWDLT
uniref:Uncharacterized protein n=1 Tax=Oryza glumipatula TaxID=40148 RepID=A0A0D9ZIP0_9ORYZ